MSVSNSVLIQPVMPHIKAKKAKSHFNSNSLHQNRKNREFLFNSYNVIIPTKSSRKLATNLVLNLGPSHLQKLNSGQGNSWMNKNYIIPEIIGYTGRMQNKLNSVYPSKPAEISTVEDLLEFICSGPLFDNLGLTTDEVEKSINKWISYGSLLCRLFKLNELSLTIPEKARVYHYYLPVFLWCEQQISKHSSFFKDGEDVNPLVIGFSAPQGCGKTTLVFALDYLFRSTGRKSATISIDDFYLTADDQAKLRDGNPGNKLLKFRGNAGSHDLSLSVETLTSLSKLSKEGMKMKLPRYDKSAYSGRGDRCDTSEWPEVEGPLSVILFEGWMLGFKPVPVEVVKEVDPQLEIVNKNLEAYHDTWDKFVNAWIVIKIKDPKCVYQWRLQAEIAMRADGKPGMSDEEIMDFVSRYLPAYYAYLPTLYSEGPKGADPSQLLIIEIDEGRNPILGTYKETYEGEDSNMKLMLNQNKRVLVYKTEQEVMGKS